MKKVLGPLVGALTVLASVGAQSPTPPVEFGSAITVVSLPVFVTQDEGKAVAGLVADDFEIRDEGKPVKIVGFREIDAMDPAVGEELRNAPAARRQFLLLFDLSFTSIAGLVRSRKAALDFVGEGLAPADLASVATFSANRGVRVLLGFTSDRAQLKKAISTLGVLQIDRQADPLGLAYDLTDVGAAFADDVGPETGNALQDAMRAVQIRYQQSEEAQYRRRILALLDGMGQLAKSLDAVQGRKQVVFLSAGFDERALVGTQGEQGRKDSEAVVAGRIWEVESDDRFGDAQIRNQMTQMLRAFSTSDSVVHSVDLAGLSARGDVRQQSSEPVFRSGRESLSQIAGLTGGRLFKDRNDVGSALREIAEMSRNYYLLAFEPSAARGPGHFHKLRVRVKGKGRAVSYRTGYFERSAYSERPAMARKFEAAEIIAKGLTGGDLDLRVLAVPYHSLEGRVTLPVVLEVSGQTLLSPKAATHLGLEIYGYALDPAGRVEDVVALVSNLNIPKVGDRLKERGVQCHATFTLPVGKHTLRFMVRDAETGRSGFRWFEVSVPPFDTKEVLLFPPLFMDDPARWVILEAASRETKGVESPFYVASDAFTPRGGPRLVNGRPESVCLLAFDGGAHYDPGASFEIRPQLLAKDGTAVSLGRFEVARAVAGADGFRRFVLRFTPTNVAPGDYTFRVRLRDPASTRTTEAFQAVRVESSP